MVRPEGWPLDPPGTPRAALGSVGAARFTMSLRPYSCMLPLALA